MVENPLGKSTVYDNQYDSGLLYAVDRQEARAALSLGGELPFQGVDFWHAWELTWLDANGKPLVATATFQCDATSPNIIESKSLKLYLNSFSMTHFESIDDVSRTIVRDLSATAGSSVDVEISMAGEWSDRRISVLPGTCIDALDLTALPQTVDADLLVCDSNAHVDETLHSHLFRSNCPVTNQPDIGSVMVRYRGPTIDRSSLLTYLVSYRQHNDFHEACVERIFMDIKNRCQPEELSVHAFFNRRGGLDINPFRTDTDAMPANLRLWRQ